MGTINKGKSNGHCLLSSRCGHPAFWRGRFCSKDLKCLCSAHPDIASREAMTLWDLNKMVPGAQRVTITCSKRGRGGLSFRCMISSLDSDRSPLRGSVIQPICEPLIKGSTDCSSEMTGFSRIPRANVHPIKRSAHFTIAYSTRQFCRWSPRATT